MSARPEQLRELMGLGIVDDVYRDIEAMQHLGLIRVTKLWPRQRYELVERTPTLQAMRLYVRCQGFTGSLDEFFTTTPKNDSGIPKRKRKSGH